MLTKQINVRRVHSELRDFVCEVPEQFDTATMRQPSDFAKLFSFLESSPREEVWVALLDSRYALTALHHVSTGTATTSLIHPREAIGPALRLGACAIVLVHNHPSGDPSPSAEDQAVTERIMDACELVGIPLLDHIVIAQRGYTSLRGLGVLTRPR
jgi:DNA repair protein RadC